MGHLTGKDIYKQLGRKIDGLTMRAPMNGTFYNILKELYSSLEAEIIVKMPYCLSKLERISKITKIEKTKLLHNLEALCSKGLVVDFLLNGKYHYMQSPMVIGIFEFTMMRVMPDTDHKVMAGLFHDYLSGDDSFYASNAGDGKKISIMRTLAHEESISNEDFVEVYDYDKASSFVEQTDKFALGLCSCRHEKKHIDEKLCKIPVNKCSSFGKAADYLIRHKMATEISKSEMLENIEESRELKLILTTDNVKNNPDFMCHCCKCCCNLLKGIHTHGYPNTIVTSAFIPKVNEDNCTGCELCSKSCPVNAIKMIPKKENDPEQLTIPVFDETICLGCGVCSLSCKKEAIKLVKRQQNIILPETTFEKVILQCLERGTLQNQLFDNPSSLSHKVLRGIVGGFLRIPPVKQALMSDLLRSGFLTSLKTGTKLQGRGWLSEI